MEKRKIGLVSVPVEYLKKTPVLHYHGGKKYKSKLSMNKLMGALKSIIDQVVKSIDRISFAECRFVMETIYYLVTTIAVGEFNTSRL